MVKKAYVFLGIGLIVALTLVLTGCFHEAQQKKIDALKKKTEQIKKEANDIKNNAKQGITKEQLKKQKEAMTDEDTDGKKFGYIEAVYIFNHVPYLEINYARMLYGEEAAKAAKAEEGVEQLDMDYYISDHNPKLRTFEIADNPQIIMHTSQMSSEGKIGPKKFSFNDFMNIFNSDDKHSKQMIASPYWIVLKGKKVVKIEEQYLP